MVTTCVRVATVALLSCPANPRRFDCMDDTLSRSRPWGLLAAGGALLAAASVALLAYASHASDGPTQERLQTAGMLALVHGAAVAALASRAQRRMAGLAVLALYIGALLFSGSLVLNALVQWPSTFAPAGGALLIAGWLLWAAAAVRG